MIPLLLIVERLCRDGAWRYYSHLRLAERAGGVTAPLLRGGERHD